MSIQERCLLVEQALNAEEEVEDLQVEYQDLWEVLEDEFEHERTTLLARKKGKSSQGGDGWPPTAARSP